MNLPNDRTYAKSHEWLLQDGAIGTVGISDHAQAELTDVVYVELPAVGATFAAGEQACVVESVKAVSPIYTPVSGEITEVNETLTTDPGLINTAPYTDGWIFRIKVKAGSGEGELLSATDYEAQLGGA